MWTAMLQALQQCSQQCQLCVWLHLRCWSWWPASGLGEKGMALEIIEPLWEQTNSKLNEWWKERFGKTSTDKPPFIIITGFVCRTLGGRPTTLKRSGSDYSATIFAKVMGASSVTMWKNVNGVYTADPR